MRITDTPIPAQLTIVAWPDPIDQLISPALRSRLADLDPLLNLDRVTRLITVERAGRPSRTAA